MAAVEAPDRPAADGSRSVRDLAILLGIQESAEDLALDEEYVGELIDYITEFVEEARLRGGTLDVSQHCDDLDKPNVLEFLMLIMKLGVAGENGTAHGALEDLLLRGEVGLALVVRPPREEDVFEHYHLVILKRCYCNERSTGHG